MQFFKAKQNWNKLGNNRLIAWWLPIQQDKLKQRSWETWGSPDKPRQTGPGPEAMQSYYSISTLLLVMARFYLLSYRATYFLKDGFNFMLTAAELHNQ